MNFQRFADVTSIEAPLLQMNDCGTIVSAAHTE
jgi:hypothetical protein